MRPQTYFFKKAPHSLVPSADSVYYVKVRISDTVAGRYFIGERIIGIVYKEDNAWMVKILFSFLKKKDWTHAQYQYLPYSAATREEAGTFLYARAVR